ncbi:A/G-specific adenine glycosylase [Pseudomonadota bacterium]
MPKQSFSTRLLNWFDKHGRKDLPWQQGINPYRVWVSEIMLQQTQVSTVIPYFERFMEQFPDVVALADANQDEVLHLWTGLGYYARARNLHNAAQVIRDDYSGKFPRDINEVIALKGIGRSTAGAILSISDAQHHPILDGNVKRVLARYHAITEWPGKQAVEKEMWQLAEQHTPKKRNADYTQAIMDLGATLCRRSKPLCEACPMTSDCQALAQGLQNQLPVSRPKKQIPTRKVAMLLLKNDQQQVLLQQRPPSGIWGGLWSLPELDSGSDEQHIQQWCEKELGCSAQITLRGKEVRHTFSHFHLDIEPIVANVAVKGSGKGSGKSSGIRDASTSVWYNPAAPDARGLAAPVKKLLHTLTI